MRSIYKNFVSIEFFLRILWILDIYYNYFYGLISSFIDVNILFSIFLKLHSFRGYGLLIYLLFEYCVNYLSSHNTKLTNTGNNIINITKTRNETVKVV